MSKSYQEGFKNAAGNIWTCNSAPAVNVGGVYAYIGSLTPAQVNSPDFNITFSATAGNDGAAVDVSKIRVKVIYTVPLSSSTQVTRGGTGFSDVAYGPGNTVAICGANGLIQLSTDSGATWSSVSSGVSANLRKITWDGTQFVIVGDAGVILTSADGATWVSQSSGVSSSIMSIGFAPNGEMIVVGAQDIDRISTDGMIWR